MKIKSIVITDFIRGCQEFSLQLNDDNLSFIIGPNGMGKTLILNIIQILLRKNSNNIEESLNNLFKIPFTSIIINFENSNFIKVKKMQDKIVINYSIDDTKINIGKGDLTAFLQHFDIVNKYYKVFNTDLITINKHEIDKQQKLLQTTFDSCISDTGDPCRPILSFTDSGKSGNFNLLYNNGESLTIEDLSSGERKLLNILYTLIFKTAKNSLVLFDEPETSLHIEWQEKLNTFMAIYSKQQNIQIICVTHSPCMCGEDLSKYAIITRK